MDTNMQKLFKKYHGKNMQDDCSVLSRDFKTFASAMKRAMKADAATRGFELAKFNTGHYSVSGFFRKDEKYVYFSWDWNRINPINLNASNAFSGMLVRTAKSGTDYTGGYNNFINLLGTMNLVEQLLE